MDSKKIVILLTTLAALAGLAAKLVSGEAHFDGATIALAWGAVSPAIGIFTAKAAVDAHVEEHH